MFVYIKEIQYLKPIYALRFTQSISLHKLMMIYFIVSQMYFISICILIRIEILICKQIQASRIILQRNNTSVINRCFTRNMIYHKKENGRKHGRNLCVREICRKDSFAVKVELVLFVVPVVHMRKILKMFSCYFEFV